jgi:hypothetical protein
MERRGSVRTTEKRHKAKITLPQKKQSRVVGEAFTGESCQPGVTSPPLMGTAKTEHQLSTRLKVNITCVEKRRMRIGVEKKGSASNSC